MLQDIHIYLLRFRPRIGDYFFIFTAEMELKLNAITFPPPMLGIIFLL